MNDNILIGAIGTAHLDMFKQFLLENGFAHVDDNGNVTTGKITFEKFYEIHEKFAEFLKENKQALEEAENTDSRPVIKATTHKPKAVMIGTTKAGRKLHEKNELPDIFNGGITFPTGKTHSKPVKTVLSLSFEVIDEWKDFLPANKKITPFVLEVLTHFMTLKYAGNEWTSTNILFRQMNGGDNDKKPTREFIDAVYDALWVLACTRIKIDARNEVKAGFNDRDYYQGSLLSTSIRGRETVTINGSIIDDAIHILEQSPLFEYALAKGQITPIPLGMYDITYDIKDEKKRSLERTENSTVILGYLIRAFADMINEKSDRNKDIISYDTLYDYLGVEAKTPTQLRIIKGRIRATVRAILTSWKNGGFIKDFYELTEDNQTATAGKKIAKIRLVLFTKKEFDTIHNSEIIALNK